MRYPSGIAKLAFGGELPRGDAWSMNLFINYPEDVDPFFAAAEQANDARRDMTAALVSWFKRADSAIAGNCFMQWIKLNSIGPDGKYRRQYTNEWLVQQYESSATGRGVNGVSGTPQWPHLSMVVTHRSDVSRGPASRGRTYPPMVTIGPNQDGIAGETQLVAYANSYITLLGDIAQAVPGEVSGMPLIVSNGTKANPDVGTKRPIITVEVGNVIDVQQRRRSATPEKYTRATLQMAGQAETGGVGPI